MDHKDMVDAFTFQFHPKPPSREVRDFLEYVAQVQREAMSIPREWLERRPVYRYPGLVVIYRAVIAYAPLPHKL